MQRSGNGCFVGPAAILGRSPNRASHLVDVSWADQALRDLEGIRLYISSDNPAAAGRVAAAVIAAADTLSELPDRGRPIRDGMRELTHVRPYVIRYQHSRERNLVEIVSVWHGAREAP